MKKILLVSLLVVFCQEVFASDKINKQQSIEQRLDEIRKIAERPLDIQEEKKYAKIIRQLLVESLNKGDAAITIEISDVAVTMRSNIKKQYPTIGDEEYKESQYSAGIALYGKIPQNELIDILIREANLLSFPANMALFYLYQYGDSPKEAANVYKKHSPKILAFLKDKAEEGVFGSKLQYAKILLDGIGTKADETEGIRLLKELDGDQAYMELATYYFRNKEMNEFEHYLRLAAKKNNIYALFNLGVLEQQKENYSKSVEAFERTLALDPAYHEATIELGRMYAEGWGVPKDLRKALEMMHQVVENSDNRRVKEIALENIKSLNKELAKQ